MNDVEEIVARCKQCDEENPQYYIEQAVDAAMDVWTTEQIEEYLKEHDKTLKEVELNYLDSVWRCSRHREDFIDAFNKTLAMAHMRDRVGQELGRVHP